MRKIIVSEFISLDGVIEEPQWSLEYWNDQISDFKGAELFAFDALLLGRITYEGFAAAWPSRTDEDGYADRINSMPKYVISSTLKSAEWQNSTLIADDVVAQVQALKQQPGQDILIFGSGTLVQSLIPHQLIDEYQLLVYPLVLGQGKRLFGPHTPTKLSLLEVKSFSSGAILQRYATAPTQ